MTRKNKKQVEPDPIQLTNFVYNDENAEREAEHDELALILGEMVDFSEEEKEKASEISQKVRERDVQKLKNKRTPKTKEPEPETEKKSYPVMSFDVKGHKGEMLLRFEIQRYI